ncbi:omptin family outer membrane protease [Devosia algicola]|uniref:omptin family outer membrane protease n=1 Tax=Devosia algicola TaxID=3026418 RepID=UPI003898FDB3
MFLEGNEFVYNGDYRVSRLNWRSRSPVLRGSIDVNLASRFSVRAEGSAAGFGTSYMEDYDWLGGSDAEANWTHRSQHDDTRLDHYFSGSLALGYELFNDGDANVRFLAGAEYTDVKWSAYGGSYIYSSTSLRDTIGVFPAGSPAIAYRQQFPEVFVGFDGDVNFGNVRWGGMMRGGFTVYSRATDDHWMRNLNFVDTLNVAPSFALGTDVGYQLGQNAEVFLAARYDQIMEQRGDTEITDTNTGVATTYRDTGAGQLQSLTLTGGFKGKF